MATVTYTGTPDPSNIYDKVYNKHDPNKDVHKAAVYAGAYHTAMPKQRTVSSIRVWFSLPSQPRPPCRALQDSGSATQVLTTS